MRVTSSGRVVTSATDLAAAAACEFGWLRQLDAKLGRVEAQPVEEDAMLARTAQLGDAHEAAVLRALKGSGLDVVEIGRPSMSVPGSVEAAVAETLEAFRNGADVVFQATFADDDENGLPFIGFADFIVRRPDGRYRVQDTKLARKAKVTALFQLAAYAGQLRKNGIEVDDHVDLILGDQSISTHKLADIEPMYIVRRKRLVAMVKTHLAEDTPAAWNDPRYLQCGACAECVAQVAEHRDLRLVYRLTSGQRTKLRPAGIETIDDLAAWAPGQPTGGVPSRTMTRLAKQAALQVQSEGLDQPLFEVADRSILEALPAPSPGDLFFDFEGDPLWTRDNQTWGLDYLFGMVDAAGDFTAFWAHSMDQERQALLDFLNLVEAKRAEHPDMHIYHYAAYERAHLSSIAQRHGVGEDRVDALLREHVLVDLYGVLGRSLVVGTPSYSIKKIEALHMAGAHREGVTNAADSVDQYAQYVQLRDLGEIAEAERLLQEIADYNEYDCISTLKLRDWLLKLVPDGVGSSSRGTGRSVAVDVPKESLRDAKSEEREAKEAALQELRDATAALAGEPFDPHRTAEQKAWGIANGALDFHAREDKSFWWEHFFRLSEPVEEWAEHRDVFFVDQENSEVTREWSKQPRARLLSRDLALAGELTPGSGEPSYGRFLIYDYPSPRDTGLETVGQRNAWEASVGWNEHSERPLEVSERVSSAFPATYDVLPMAVAPGSPIATHGQRASIQSWVESALAEAPEVPRNPIGDLLLRRPSRLTSGALARVDGADTISAVVDSALRLDRSYLAVQGPPGTGKTYVSSHVAVRLVQEHGWRIGVVAQSHKVVDNVLTKIIAHGLDPERVLKVQSADYDDPDLVERIVASKDIEEELAAMEGGFVVGGTAWAFAKIEGLDLIMVDEAGQYSLANTMAVSLSGRNLMLFGDPQQLPQVSTATHPEPADHSALGWLSAGHDVLPAEFGYFLPDSWRMDAAVTQPVSELSYDGQLRSHSSTVQRSLAGEMPGLETLWVNHSENTTESVEEAEAVLQLVKRHVGQMWNSGGVGAPCSLEESDVIVVTPYNAQVGTVRRVLAGAGFGGVRVGTVDKFQGQEAVIAITTLAASSASAVARGLEFLLMKNRLNVSISRAKWKAYLICSPGLLDKLPGKPAELALMSGFAALTAADATPM
ncbi:TM0106 family RecB-like putative nuclease [Galactobacter valiniphilus]|uniref:TM0106 family RecB-like putative nuclease n=1 Tax=Galactobacter valiniphilus TaxID=2676122 RepID=UPI003735B709